MTIPSRDEIRLAEIAFLLRHGDAVRRASRLRARCVEELAKIGREARQAGQRGASYPSPEMFEARAEMVQVSLDEIDTILKTYGAGKRNLEIEERGPTVEAVLMRLKELRNSKGDPLARMFANGAITADDWVDAREIAAIWRAVTSRLTTHTMRLNEKSAGETEARRLSRAEANEKSMLLHSFVYVPWSKHVGSNAVQLVLAIAVEGQSVRALRRRFSVSSDTVVQRFTNAIECYRDIRETNRASWDRVWERSVA